MTYTYIENWDNITTEFAAEDISMGARARAAAGRCHMPICHMPICPYANMPHADWSFYAFNNVFSFYALSYSDIHLSERGCTLRYVQRIECNPPTDVSQ
jgi:hypothetical protein